MDCVNCGAPLPAKSNVCGYCKTLNDVDLRDRRAVRTAASQRPCPRCQKPMALLHFDLGQGLEIDRCDHCHGIFFDPGELERVLEDAGRVEDVDHRRLAALVEEETPTGDFQQVAYVPCPDCAKLMNRKSYGARSGVVVDQCRDHGVWLDGGELRRLVQWTRAGGRLHQERQAKEKAAMEEKLRGMPATVPSGGFETAVDRRRSLLDDAPDWGDSLLVGALGAIARWLR